MFSLYYPVIRWAERRALIGRNRHRTKPEQGRFTGAEVDGLVKTAWRKYEGLVPNLPPQPTLGSRMNVQFSALTLSLFQVLLDAGIERPYAVELVSDTTWHVYKQLGRFVQLLTRILPRSVTKPMQNDADVARHVEQDGTFALGFPFTAPGYIAHYIPMHGAAGFDMVRCPVAQIFREHGMADLGKASWCDLDYALGDIKHLRLERSTTIMEGSDRCTFRLHFDAATATSDSSDGTTTKAPLKAGPYMHGCCASLVPPSA